ncbi:MAG TPA: BatA and WFA domain-containing protein [Phycisphaerales bacterium]|nr:BatA and WFA domain-containing protein [Phycisphaerales bacterium]
MPWSSVTFLDPVAGVIAAAVGVPILLLWYFLKLRRRPVRVSSTMLWESAAQDLQVNAPFRMIRPSWLLLLQLVLLGLICAALGRPALDLPAAPAEKMILLIDRSASMSANDAGPPHAGSPAGAGTGYAPEKLTRLALAKRRAVEVVSRLGARSRVTVVTMAARPEIIADDSRDRGALRNAINAIEATDQPADFDAALGVVAAIVSRQSSADESPSASREAPAVVLLSDGSLRHAIGNSAAGIGSASFRFILCGPSPDAAEELDNVGIVGLSARRAYDDPATVQVFVRIRSVVGGTAPVATALSLALDGEPIVSTGATGGAAGGGAGGGVLSIPPADAEKGGVSEVTRTFVFQNTTGGVLTATLSRVDSLESDNFAGMILRPPGAPRILLVQPESVNARADAILQDALGWFKPRELATRRIGEYERMAGGGGAGGAGGATGGSGSELASFDLIVFDRVAPSRLPAKASMSFGAGLPIPGLIVEPANPSAPSDFTYWVRSHPVMRYVSLNGVTVFDPMRITAPAEEGGGTRVEAGGAPVKSTALASGADGPLILLLESGATRRLIVGFGPDASWWFKELSFPVFVKNAVDYLTLTGEDAAGRVLTTAEPIAVRALPGSAEVVAEGPATIRRTVQSGGAASVTLGVLPRAGLYALSGAENGNGGADLPVNVMDLWESAIATASSVDVAGSNVVSTGVGATAPREIRDWLLIAAAALLGIEWFVYAWKMRV